MEKLTIQQLAKQAIDSMERVERGERTIARIKKDAPQWVTDVAYCAHGYAFPDDDIYEALSEALSVLADMDEDADEDDARDAINEIEPDPYTGHLLAWLAARVDRVEYLTIALRDFGPFDDGFKLLAMAQKLFLDEIGESVLSSLVEIQDGMPEPEESEAA